MHAALPGVRLWYTDTGGDGLPIVLLHANTGTLASWGKQVGPLAGAGHRVIAFDRRGWGHSVADPATGPQPGSIAEDLDALADHLGLGRFCLLGIAGGGFAALDYAGWRPQRLRGLIVAASYGKFDEPEIRDAFARLTPPEFLALPEAIREVGPAFRFQDPEGLARWVAIEEHARQPGATAQPLRTPNTYAKLAAIACPVLVLAAGADLYAPPALMRLWAARLPRHDFAVVAEAGHAVNWERPEDFNAAVLGFLRTL